MSAKFKWVFISLLILLSLRATLPQMDNSAVESTLTPATVVRIIDGDTIDVSFDNQKYRIRLIGVDTPERNEKGYALATQFTMDHCPKGSTVYLESDVNDTDKYGRLLRYVWLTPAPKDFTVDSLNGQLLVQKMAVPLWMNGDTKYEAQSKR